MPEFVPRLRIFVSSLGDVLEERRIARPVDSVEALRAGLRALRPGEADAFIYASDTMIVSQEELFLDTARAKKLPTMLSYQGNVSNGTRASYGENRFTL